MIIDVRRIKLQGKSDESFTFSEDFDNSLISIPDSVFASPVTVECIAEVYPDKVFVSGKVSYKIKGPCSRCLNDAEFSSTCVFDEKFVPDTEEFFDDQALVYSLDKIDLKPFISELILTDMPLSILCDEACKGLCPVCGADMNITSCGHDRNN